jgi:hypothetical protein
MLITVVSLAKAQDSGRINLHTALQQAWPRLRAERDVRPTADKASYVGDSGTVGEPLHPKAMQINANQFRIEIPTPRDCEFDRSGADRCCILVGVLKGLHSTRGHLNLASKVRHVLEEP